VRWEKGENEEICNAATKPMDGEPRNVSCATKHVLRKKVKVVRILVRVLGISKKRAPCGLASIRG